ncbi:MAG: TIGR03960 family B12-binding radical SAM protein [Deltaproteobacteria bacterium]|nr:TIGR03960 family B12-binding radical SAM protein [Deltaproteobacteria bacterium]
MTDPLKDLLCQVNRPARYLGGEAGSVVKDPALVRLTLALAFPEVYEIGMSHQGLKVLYEALAPRPEVAAERIFCPWTDLLDLLERRNLAPWSLETGRPLGEFDVVGFSLLYELTYTNMLQMLKLARIPLRREDRNASHPLVIAGGGCMVNPEPVADFLDLAVVGEAEELIHELVDLLIQAKTEAWDRPTLYRRAMDLPGVYAPALFEPGYRDGRLVTMRALDPAHPVVRRRVVSDLARHQPPSHPVSPWVKPVHDRVGLEISRGCTRGCRFCQAGYIYRPARERPPAQLMETALAALAATGQEELALLSLSAGDYTCIEALTTCLMDSLEPLKVGLSLPSLRVDSLSPELIGQIKRVRKTGFTLAPEAGSQRLRASVNKDLTEEQILATARRVFELGWNHVKLYFMVGLPGETDEDLAELARLAGQVAAQAKAAGRGRGKKPVVHASLGVFVPKPHTPFQWEAQLSPAEAQRRLYLTRDLLHRQPGVQGKWNDLEQAWLEGVFSRGDRRLGAVLARAVELGCRFDGWREEMNPAAWRQALAESGIEPLDYLRAREAGEMLPWDHMHTGVTREFLLEEKNRSLAGERTPDCRRGDCAGCGVCDFETLEPRLADTAPPAVPTPAVLPEERTKYRFRLHKTGPASLLGHLEMMSQLERGVRRTGIPLAHSQGFHPHPLVKAANALPLGVESLVEILEVTILGYLHPEELARRINEALPQGLSLHDGRLSRPGDRLAEPDEVTYRIHPARPADQAALAEFGAAATWPWVRRSPKGDREMDLRQAVTRLEITNGHLVVAVRRLGARPKPAEVLESVFGFSREEALASSALKIAAHWEDSPAWPPHSS